jgi:curved DNA-binding protein
MRTPRRTVPQKAAGIRTEPPPSVPPHPVFRLVGREFRADLPVAPWEAALGARVPVETLAGRLNVRIPVGCTNGRRCVFAAAGCPIRGAPGDLVLTVRIRIPANSSATDRAFFEALAASSNSGTRRSSGIGG